MFHQEEATVTPAGWEVRGLMMVKINLTVSLRVAPSLVKLLLFTFSYFE